MTSTGLQASFVQLAQELVPSGAFITAGNKVAAEVFKALEASADLSVARRVIAGSMGKRTALNEDFDPDYDLVAFLNPDPAMRNDQILEKFVEILKAAARAKKLPSLQITKETRFSVQFKMPVKFGNETKVVEFDLLPAINFGNNQAQGAMEATRARMGGGGDAADNAVHYMSPSLAAETLSFMKEAADSNIHRVILVAKYWDRLVKEKGTVKGLVSARSHIIELIVIDANRNLLVPENEKNSVYFGFERFLKSMTQLDKLCIIFESKYTRQDIPKDIAKEMNERPFILDPVNYFNNLGKELVPEVVEQYKKFAAGTLAQLQVRGAPINIKNFAEIVRA